MTTETAVDEEEPLVPPMPVPAPKRPGVLLAMLTLGMSLIFFMPKPPDSQPLGVVDPKDVPEYVAAWRGEDGVVTENERATLGKDTEFARKRYTTLSSYATPSGSLPSSHTAIDLSLVLSGQDMNTSIHRAERCLPTQGWTILEKESVVFRIPDRGSYDATRLLNSKLSQKDGKPVAIRMITYYWFVGLTDVTGSHFTRTYIDMRDRLMQGFNQRWAYISLSAEIPVQPDAAKQAKADAATDHMMRDFIRQFSPKVMKETVALAQ